MADAVRLSIAADLTGDFDGKPFQIRSDGERAIICDFADLNSLLAIRRVAGKHVKFRELGCSLDELEYSVEIRIRGSSIVGLGNLVRSTFWQLLGFPATKIRLAAIAAVMLKPKA